ncbi:hypothetical protein ACRAWD_22600 [Caulobacter segnis]
MTATRSEPLAPKASEAATVPGAGQAGGGRAAGAGIGGGAR